MGEPRVLVIENDLFFSSKIKDTLSQIGLVSVLSSELDEILKLFKEFEISLVILDLLIDKMDPIVLLHRLKGSQNTCHIPVIAFAEHTEKKLLQEARETGCEIVVNNRSVVKELKNLIEAALPDLSV